MNKSEIFGSLLAGMMFLSSCASVTETNKYQATESIPTLENAAEMPYEKFTPTIEPLTSLTEGETETPEPLFTGDIFFDPQNEADFGKVVESPSPIDEPEAFAKWQDEYLHQVNAKLEDNDGPSIDLEWIGIDFDFARFSIVSEDWPVIASYKFKWRDQEILTKTFVFKDKKGTLVPLSFTYTTPDSLIFDQGLKYTTPSTRKELILYFEWKTSTRDLVKDDFMEEFLPDEKHDVSFDSKRRIMSGNGTVEDINIVSRERFVVQKFS